MSIFQSDEDVERQLSHEANVLHKLMHDNSRPKGIVNIPKDEKVMIGALARSIGPSEAAKVFDVAISTASNAAKGMTTHNKTNQELKAKVEDKVKDIHEVAAEKLLSTLNFVDMEKVAEAKPRDQVAIAKDLASVIDKTTQRDDTGTHVQVVVYAPQSVPSSSFPTIEVNSIPNE